ncbi:MAG: S8 family serine peptidase [Eubacterium sp.]|nr:S8 family serine peptidase [Eubacterium sp.]
MKKIIAFLLIAGVTTGLVPVSAAADTTNQNTKETQDHTTITVVTRDQDEAENEEIQTQLKNIQANFTDVKQSYRIDMEKGVVYESDGSEKKIEDKFGMSDEQKQEFKQDGANEKKEMIESFLNSENAGIYTVTEDEENSDMVTVEYPYQLHRVVVDASNFESDEQLYSTYEATAAIYDSLTNHYILKYDTEQETQNAYNSLVEYYTTDNNENNDDCVYNDVLVSVDPTTTATTESTSTDWGVTTMGLDEAISDASSTNDEVVVAVLDTGIYEDHELFEDRILTDLSYSYITDDSSSSQRPLNPWESQSGSSSDSSGSTDVSDDNGHGTHVAGIVAQGTSDNVQLMIIKVMDADGSGSLEDIASAVTYATSNGADVINISAGATGVSTSYAESCGLESALSSAKSSGVFTAVASGNDATDIESSYCYPAYSNYVYTVGSINSELEVSSYSNYGDSLDFATPGESITSAATTGTSDYVTYSGTSMATPYLVAAAAMEKTLNGASDSSYNEDEIASDLEEISTNLGDSGWDQYYGNGMPCFASDSSASKGSSSSDSSSSWKTKTITVKTSNGAKLKYKIKKSSKTATLKSVVKQKSKITIPATITYSGVKYKVTAIGSKAFSGKKKIKKVVIGSNVKKIGKKAFYKATNLKTVKIKSKKITSIKSGAFKKIKANAKFYLPSSKYSTYKTMIKKVVSSSKIKYKKI